jgi:2-oxoglutarate dehydrogenase E2 component (dihydrolipoamide succinyltransferase)
VKLKIWLARHKLQIAQFLIIFTIIRHIKSTVIVMAKIELVLPSMGEGIIEATITKWLVSEGDTVEEDQPVLEIATDKVDSEIPSPVNGVVKKILMKEGEVPSIGSPLAEIETGSDEDPDREEVIDEVERIKTNDQKTLAAVPEPSEKFEHTGEVPRQTPSGKFLTPLVRSIAGKENISVSELDNIRGSGDKGRITRNDIMDYLSKRTGLYEKEESPEPLPDQIAPGKEDRLVEMDRMRKLIARHMVASKQTSPHVTSFIDADVTNLVKWRTTIKEEFRKRENQKITYTPIFIEAAAKALRDYPMINVSLDDTTIIVKKNINIGMAVALPDGNLIVPVIKNADEKSLVGLVKAVNDLADRARGKKLEPDEVNGGTFTITNFGTFGNTTGTPIINQPEAAILGLGAIVKKPVVLETDSGDVIAIRHIMTISLSYDHRMVDGALGGMFLKRIAEYLEGFEAGRKI